MRVCVECVCPPCFPPITHRPHTCIPGIIHTFQVQLLYDLAALNGEGRRGQGSNREEDAAADKRLLAATEDTMRALTRLAEQASTKMSLAATKTDYKEAALWRDRRDALLAAVQLVRGEQGGMQPAVSRRVVNTTPV